MNYYLEINSFILANYLGLIEIYSKVFLLFFVKHLLNLEKRYSKLNYQDVIVMRTKFTHDEVMKLD